MTNHAEDVLLLSLTDTDALESLAEIGLPEAAVPTEIIRPIYRWAVDQFFASGRTVAPTREALLMTWGQQIEDAQIDLLAEDEDNDTVQWAIETLKAQYAHSEYQVFLRASGIEIANSANPDKVKAVSKAAEDLFMLSESLQTRHSHDDGIVGTQKSLAAYEARARDPKGIRGLRFGLGPVDQHTGGIRPGELAVVGAPAKAGKSFLLMWAAKEAWVAGKTTVLYTLENSTEMTYNRLICGHLGINARQYQDGECSDPDVARVREFTNDVVPTLGRLEVIQPQEGQRTMAAMVRKAQTLGVQRLFIDQLTFVEQPEGTSSRLARDEVVKAKMHALKNLINDNERIPCVLAHQVNRVGTDMARKLGYLLMEHMAEGAEVERTADSVFGLFRGDTDTIAGEAVFQILAARRFPEKAWKIVWQPEVGNVGVVREVDLRASVDA
jgi:hypothetical protein